ncbi:Bcr/CflA family drug resistance efflux transporter [Pseudoxanthomonas kalamensis DSM 18571]|uniref:multidrug effflux MFS transporter n=1 Tax=Pseudoxanthomonas kalamensis TaxID=289483 RepID=UPI0013917BD4|nr:multidrug effflux MFS transporter [Pseudoxanthomonas kalamensis]KAF1709375.1 Bcr/CflA family drug resistance efflux transporter [Pseudoxanthomonas kalamensis DSM 18571]
MKSAPAVSIPRLTVLLAGLAMFGPFSIDTIFPAFPAIAADLGADKLAMQQTVSIYLLSFALMSLVHGPLSDALGRRRIILAGLVVFVLASVGCALAGDLSTLLIFRALQGLSAGVGMIVGRAVIRDVLQGDAAQRMMSQVTMIFGVAPALAPVVGGWLLGWGRWTLIFWFLVVFSVFLLLATWAWLPETHPKASRISLRPKMLLWDYSSIFFSPRFQRLAAAAAFNFGALFLFIASAPAFVVDILGLGERQFGWFFIPMISGMMAGSFVSARTAGRISRVQLANIGFLCCAVAVACNLGYSVLAEAPKVPWAVLPMTLNAFGIALVFPIVTLEILDMYPHQRGSASSMQAFTGLALNALIAGVLSPLLSDDIVHLTLGATVLMLLGWTFWRWEMRLSKPAATSDMTASE